MSYTKTNWVNNSEPPISADNLNKIEQGIYDATEGLAGKVDKVTGKGLSTNDYTDAEKTKLAGIDMTTKQDTLVSGTNIKTINGSSLLGPGNIVIEGGGGGGSENIAAEYSASSTYAVGDYCIYDGQLYRCTTAITTAEAWTAALWTMATVGGELTDLKGDIPQAVSDLTNDAGYLTSHQSIKTINGTSMVGSGNVAVQPTLVSGTNIKTVNSTSLLGSGNIAVQAKISAVAVTIAAADWSATTTCTKSVSGVTASNNVVVTTAPASIADWQSAGVYCSAQGSGTLTFTCSSTPSASITVNVLVIN